MRPFEGSRTRRRAVELTLCDAPQYLQNAASLSMSFPHRTQTMVASAAAVSYYINTKARCAPFVLKLWRQHILAFMNPLLTDLYGHQAWADAQHWRAIGAHRPARDDRAIRRRLHH